MSFDMGFTRLLVFIKLGALVRLRGLLPALGRQYATFSQSIHRGHVALGMLLSDKRARSVSPLLLLLLLILSDVRSMITASGTSDACSYQDNDTGFELIGCPADPTALYAPLKHVKTPRLNGTSGRLVDASDAP